MKKTFIIILALIFVLPAFNVYAEESEPKVRTVKIIPSSITVSPGDVLTVDIVIDSTERISSLYYRFAFDNNIFSADSSVYEDYPELQKCVDKDWYEYYNELGASYVMNLFAINYNRANNIFFSGVNINGVSNNTDNMVIGRFFLTVKDNVPAGNTTLTLNKATTSDIYMLPDTYTKEADMKFNDVVINIDGKQDETLSDMKVTDNGAEKVVDDVSVTSPDNKPGVLFVSCYRNEDGRSVLIDTSIFKVTEESYVNNVAVFNGIKIPREASMVRTAFWSSPSILNPVSKSIPAE